MALKKIKFAAFTLLAVVSLFFLLNNFILKGNSYEPDPKKFAQLLGQIIYLIKDDYVEEPNPSKTMAGAFRGLVNSLDDLTSYLDIANVNKFRQRSQSRLMETGLILYKNKKYRTFPVIIGIKKNSPAEKLELKIGEAISFLDDRSTLNMSMLEANLYLQDINKNPINVKIIRKNKTQLLSLERQLLNETSFTLSQAKELGGILKIHDLYSPIVETLKTKLMLKLKDLEKPLILDLRNCHEGTLPEAVKFINLFLQKEKIGHLEKKDGFKEILSCPKSADLENLRLVIWTNQATIGPSEVVASVLKTHRKAKIVGLKTPGLTAQQKFFPLEDGSGLLLTSAIFTPDSNEKLWEIGITPDVEIKIEQQDSESFLKATRELLSVK